MFQGVRCSQVIFSWKKSAGNHFPLNFCQIVWTRSERRSEPPPNHIRTTSRATSEPRPNRIRTTSEPMAEVKGKVVSSRAAKADTTFFLLAVPGNNYLTDTWYRVTGNIYITVIIFSWIKFGIAFSLPQTFFGWKKVCFTLHYLDRYP